MISDGKTIIYYIILRISWAFSFCEMYPEYIKFFTTETMVTAVSFDATTLATFSLILQAVGCLLLDFYRKPKQLDKFVGYLAMLHKDMPLKEDDLIVCLASLNLLHPFTNINGKEFSTSFFLKIPMADQLFVHYQCNVLLTFRLEHYGMAS